VNGHHAVTLRLLTEALLLGLVMTVAFLVLVAPSGHAQGPGEEVLYEDNFNGVPDGSQAPGWQLDPRWNVTGGMLWGNNPPGLAADLGTAWATCIRDHWDGGQLGFSFRIVALEGTLHFNIRLNQPNRYAIGAVHRTQQIYTARFFGGNISFYIFRQAGELLWSAPMNYYEFIQQGHGHVQVTTDGGNINVYAGVTRDPVLTFRDPNPLPPGNLAFEIVEGTTLVDDVVVTGQRPPVAPSTITTTMTEFVTSAKTVFVTTTETVRIETVPPVFYLYVIIGLLVTGGLGLVAGRGIGRTAGATPPPPSVPPPPRLTSASIPPPPRLPPATAPVTPPPTPRSIRPAGALTAKKRIIVHFMNEEERLAAMEKMTQIDQTESFLVGEIDEGDIAELQRQGLVVQAYEASQDWVKAETPGGESEPLPGIKRAVMRVGPPRAAPLPVDLTKPNFYLIGLKGPLLEVWRKKLEELGVRFLEHMPRNSYTAKLTPKQVDAVAALSFVSGVRLYGPEDTGPVSLIRAQAPAPAPGAAAMITYDVRLHQEEDLDGVLQWLKAHGVSVAGSKGRKIRLYLLGDSPLTDELAALPEVASMEEYVPPKLLNNVARMLLGIDRQSGPSRTTDLPQTGQGQIVAVADTGLDDKHPDFQGRIAGIVAVGRTNDYSDPNGHGTHVAGSVLGDGAASGGVIRGTAPKAKLFFQSLLSADGGLGLPLSLGDLFEEAYQAGARIHNNSWGSATRSMYTINSIEVDEFVAKRRDMLIVIAAGNEGQAASCLHSQPGYVDWLSIGSPASCKNALTVGASRSSRTSGGYATLTYGQAWPDGFPNPPASTETVSGNSEGVAAFSSRGPCDDRRIKPDIVAPGTDIASTKSSRAPLRNFWGPYPNNSMYAFMGGTSMAAPLVAGCATLVREYYTGNRNHEPSAALLKATLINSTKWLTGTDAVADHPNAPNYHQGFGCIWMPWAIPNSSMPNLKLEFLDTWKDPDRHFVRTGQRFRFQFSISGGNWVRICLAYTDIAARALQNNLDLFVQHMQSGKKWVGNADLPSGLKIPDPDNNVEVVRLENPPTGDYLVQISASNLLQAGQDFALVVTGDLASHLVQV
jgi:serine protease AprX